MNRLVMRILIVSAALLIVGGALFYRSVQPQALIGAGYVAHQVCSCVFVAERSYAACLPDLLPSMDRIESEIVEQEGRRGVHARVSGFADRIAIYTPGLGCALE